MRSRCYPHAVIHTTYVWEGISARIKCALTYINVGVYYEIVLQLVLNCLLLPSVICRLDWRCCKANVKRRDAKKRNVQNGRVESVVAGAIN